MKTIINARFIDESEAVVSLMDHGLHYGDGVYETLRTYSQKSVMCEEHIQRLFASAKAIHLTIPATAKEIQQQIQQIIACNKQEIGPKNELVIKVIVTRGIGQRGLTSSCTPTLIITADKLPIYPKNIFTKGVAVCTTPYFRVLPAVKSLNCLAQVCAKQEADKKKCFEALLCSSADADIVTEGTITNLFIVKDKAIFTPKNHVLLGITRETVLSLAKRMQPAIKVMECDIRKTEFYGADEVFLTNSLMEIVPVVKVDGVAVGKGSVGKITKELMETFKRS
ncbi:aminotransferase class IV [Candidatus Woesearchaeota archaeon]|nr:aminotransferase class IV [Candidatus Woesearchaeota archaeon]